MNGTSWLALPAALLLAGSLSAQRRGLLMAKQKVALLIFFIGSIILQSCGEQPSSETAFIAERSCDSMVSIVFDSAFYVGRTVTPLSENSLKPKEDYATPVGAHMLPEQYRFVFVVARLN
jgi:hypothetical protein